MINCRRFVPTPPTSSNLTFRRSLRGTLSRRLSLASGSLALALALTLFGFIVGLAGLGGAGGPVRVLSESEGSFGAKVAKRSVILG